MLILTIRTDKPEAEIGLFKAGTELVYETWQAHRELAETIHTRISELLDSHDKELSDLDGIVAFQGPGSFTGLRIGLTVANALAYAQAIPVVASAGDDWITAGVDRLLNDEDEKIALPEYGGEANITLQKK
jgi:tRNA threonylcarbamoyladenosine biosynthesis protein TsaB